MPNLQAAAILAISQEFRQRLRAALIQKALLELSSPAPAADAPLGRWRRRRQMAAGVATNPDAVIDQVAWLVANDPAVLLPFVGDATGSGMAAITDPVLEAATVSAMLVMVRIDNANDDNA